MKRLSGVKLSVVGVVFFAIVLGLFAGYFLTSIQSYVTTVSSAVVNATALIPSATNGPIGLSPTQNMFNYVFTILTNPMSIAVLIFLGFLMYALAARIRSTPPGS